MRFMKWAAAAAAIAGMALVSGCGGGGSGSGNADIRLINASVGYSSLDMSVSGSTVGTGVAYGTASAYSSQNVNATTATIASSGTTVLAPSLSTVICGARCSFIAFGWNGAISRVILQENLAQPAAGYTALNLQNLAPDAGALDIYLTASPTAALTSPIATNVAGGNGSGFVPINVGSTSATYTVTVTGAGAPTDVRLQIPSVTLPALQVATLIVTSTPGGVLLNGILAVQNGSVTNYPGTNARARIVGTLTGNPYVSGTIGTTALLATQVTPAVGDYVTLTAGAGTVNVSVATTSTGTPTVIPTATTFVTGHDYTILVSGTAGAPVVSVIDDDNRLPLTAGTAKIRLTNGLSNAGVGLSMALDFVDVARNVTPGATSTASVIPVTNTVSSLSVTSPLSSTALFTQTLTVQSAGLYEVIMSGDATVSTSLQGKLRKLR